MAASSKLPLSLSLPANYSGWHSYTWILHVTSSSLVIMSLRSKYLYRFIDVFMGNILQFCNHYDNVPKSDTGPLRASSSGFNRSQRVWTLIWNDVWPLSISVENFKSSLCWKVAAHQEKKLMSKKSLCRKTNQHFSDEVCHRHWGKEPIREMTQE